MIGFIEGSFYISEDFLKESTGPWKILKAYEYGDEYSPLFNAECHCEEECKIVEDMSICEFIDTTAIAQVRELIDALYRNDTTEILTFALRYAGCVNVP